MHHLALFLGRQWAHGLSFSVCTLQLAALPFFFRGGITSLWGNVAPGIAEASDLCWWTQEQSQSSSTQSHPRAQLYDGFIPQYNFQFGETFGRTTYRLLTDPTIARSPRALLAPLKKQKFIEDFSGTKHGVQGYLPGRPGEHNPVPSLDGLCFNEHGSKHEQWQLPFTGSVSDLSNGAEGRSSFYQRLFYFCFCFEPVKHGRVILPPLTEQPVRTEGAEEEDTWLPKTDIPNVIQQKVITGYAGFIPRLSWFHGVNYVRSVKEAMKEFDQHQFMLRNPCCSFGKRYPQNYWPTNRIYTSAGLIPSYMGFVPGNLRNTYALTYGSSTRKAYQKEQQRRACAL
uniref:Ciliary microtubule inner protein 2A n=1 Tax=Strigops habroptila TaxID=2489341 RepID=A0A672TW61_STRHB